MTDAKLPSSSVAAFTEALHGEQGALAAWLEANDERKVVAHIEAYARANVAHATASKEAEIERLRAEVGALRKALTYRRLGFDPEASMRALGEARAVLAKEGK